MDNISDDEYELVQCEEIYISDSEVDPLSEASSSNQHIEVEDKKPHPQMMKSIHFDLLPDAAKLQYIRRPTRPVRLFSFSDRDKVKRFSKTSEESKNLAMQLLDVVKSVNVRRKVKFENGVAVPNFYLLATQCDCKEGQKVLKLESTDIVNLIRDIIHMIKIGIYREVDFVEIICDSPAIFLIKYINVKNWDIMMNAVYVVTSEYLLPYLCRIKAAEEAEEKAVERIRNVVVELRPNGENRALATKRKRNNKETNVAREFPTVCTKEDLYVTESILAKYLEPDAVRFFIIQMKVSGKKQNQYRWKDDDKSLALKLLRDNPSEYNLLLQKYALPSDKTVEKYVLKLQSKDIARE